MKLFKIGLTGTMAVMLLAPITASAGSINGNEQSVLSVVQGGFEYNGIQYTAAPGYVEKVREYLSQEEVDLTSDQASEAISDIYANVQTGVSEGYIIPVTEEGASNTGEVDQQKKETGNATDTESAQNAQTAQKAESTESAENTEQILIDGSSGMVEALDEDGNTIFVAQSVIKDTGYDMTMLPVLAVFLSAIFIYCIYLIWKYRLLSEDAKKKDES